MMSAKLTTLGLLKIKLFRNKCYDVIISVHDVTNKSLPHDSDYIVNVVMLPEKTTFLRSALGSSLIILDWH